MRLFIKTAAAVLTLMLVFACVPSLAEEDGDPVLARVNGVSLTKSYVEEYLPLYYDYGYTDSLTDYGTVLEYLIERTVLLHMLSELGYYDFTEEEEEAFRTETADTVERYVAEYVSYYLSEDTPEAREELERQAREYYARYEEEILGELIDSAAFDRWFATLVTEEVTEAEVEEVFASYAAEDEAVFAGDVPMYEYYRLYGYSVFYIPEGYRKVQRILLPVDEELLSAYCTAQAVYEDNADGADAETAFAEAEKARQALLDSVKETTDAIEAALLAGESFESQILQWGTDEQMADEETRKAGYMIHRESVIYDPAVITAAFGEDMSAPGCHSAPCAGVEGVSILYYLADVPGGPAELTAQIREQIRDSLLAQRQDEAYSAVLAGWIESSEIIRDQEAINACMAAAEE